MHGFYLGGTAVAIAHSIPAGLSALIPGLQPILTSTLANRWLGERVTPLQWAGLLLGLGGVVLILHNRPMSGEAGWGWLASGVSLVSITLGTLYQRRYCNRIDWRAGNLVQYIAVTVFFGIGAWLFENNVVHWTAEFALALVWLAVVLSIGSIGLLYWLIRRSAATSVASLFYLVPAVTVADGLCAVRRAAGCGGHIRHGRLRRRGALGQPAGLSNPLGCTAIAFSSEVDTGSREENASKQQSGASVLITIRTDHAPVLACTRAPDGQISPRDKNLSSPFAKNIPLSPSGKSVLPARPVLTRQEGRIAVVTNAGWDAVDAAALARKWQSQGRLCL